MFFEVFSTNPKRRKLAELIFLDELPASVHALAGLSGLGYATTYDWLKSAEKKGLLRSHCDGKARMYRSLLSPLQKESLKSFLHPSAAFSTDKVIVESVVQSKTDPVLLRTLPVDFYDAAGSLTKAGMHFWSSHYNVMAETGFLLALSAKVSGSRKLSTLARSFRDRRRKKSKYFFPADSTAGHFKQKLVELNTPALAKKWYFNLNMPEESFQSHFDKLRNSNK